MRINKLLIFVASLLIVFSLSSLLLLSAKDTPPPNKDHPEHKDKPKGKDRPEEKDRPPEKPKPPEKTEPDDKPQKGDQKKGRLSKFFSLKDNKTPKEGNEDEEDDDDVSVSFMFEIWGEIIFGDHNFRYSSYPYGDPQKLGVYVSQDLTQNEFALQFRSYYQPIEQGLWSYGMYGKILMPSGFNLDTSFMHYTERVTTSRDEKMDYWALHFNLGAFGYDSNVVVEAGLGTAWLTDTERISHGSLSAQVNLDFFPAEPWSIHVGASYAAPTGHSIYNLEALGGWHQSHFELFLGYHALLNADGDNLDGPIFGFAFWF